MKEYDVERAKLLATYEEARKQLSDKIKPIFFERFNEFFHNYPEVETLSWRISSDIYDDENYYNGLENIKATLHAKYKYTGYEEWGWEDVAYDLKAAAGNEEIIDRFGSSERAITVGEAIMKAGRDIDHTSVEFMKDVFKINTTVVVTKEGFTVEND